VVAARESLSRALRSAPAWVTPRLVVIASAGAAIVLAFAIFIASSARGGPPRSAKTLVTAALTHVSVPKTDDRVTEASAKIDRGDFSGAIEELLPLERADGDRPEVHKLLERAYVASHAARDALREADLWLASDEAAAADVKLEEDVRNAALARDNQDDAFALLEAKMGARGVDLLYDIAYGASGRQYPQAAARARHSLDVDDVRSRASPALLVLLDLRAAKTCDAKHALLDRIRQNGDARALALLHPLQATRGCGFLSYADCYPCLHKDTALKDTIDALSDHAPP
jgi:serine/threonine-protein kinase